MVDRLIDYIPYEAYETKLKLPVRVADIPMGARVLRAIPGAQETAQRAAAERALNRYLHKKLGEAMQYTPTFAQEIKEALTPTFMILSENEVLPQFSPRDAEDELNKKIDDRLDPLSKYQPAETKQRRVEVAKSTMKSVTAKTHPDVVNTDPHLKGVGAASAGEIYADAVEVARRGDDKLAAVIAVEADTRLNLAKLFALTQQGLSLQDVARDYPELISNMEIAIWQGRRALPDPKAFRLLGSREAIDREAQRIRADSDREARTEAMKMICVFSAGVLGLAQKREVALQDPEKLLKSVVEAAGWVGGGDDLVKKAGSRAISPYTELLRGELVTLMRAVPGSIHRLAEAVVSSNGEVTPDIAAQNYQQVITAVKAAAIKHGEAMQEEVNRPRIPRNYGRIIDKMSKIEKLIIIKENNRNF